MTIVLSIRDIPGRAFRRAIRRTFVERRPWKLIIDARTSPPPSLDRLSVTLRLTRRARRHGGDVIVVVDETTHQRLAAAGVHRWLTLTRTVHQAQATLAAAQGGPRRSAHLRRSGRDPNSGFPFPREQVPPG